MLKTNGISKKLIAIDICCLYYVGQKVIYALLSLIIGQDKQKTLSVKLSIFSHPSVLTSVLGAQMDRFIETVLLSTHIICFG